MFRSTLFLYRKMFNFIYHDVEHRPVAVGRQRHLAAGVALGDHVPVVIGRELELVDNSAFLVKNEAPY